MITRFVQWFQNTGSVADRKQSGKASIMKTKVADVETALQRSPMKRPSVYINIITEFISLLNSDERYLGCRQDGATCQTSKDSMEVLTEFFDDRVISKEFWPPCPKTLSIPDFSFGDI
ncbi:DUF4817 domain-containing protein [Trichonephila clavipes]|uniref:DUF4817 domain-containing protein n=1 Tax=Trichonephila clavipes TaxID=2585209 RepID=A0A8X6RP32_TRICX|nr:DUF4817 domain-containing protein [Trichonephila clavipes]